MAEPLAQPEFPERQKCPECSACGGHHPRCSLIGEDEAKRQLSFYYDLWVTKETDVRQRLATAALHYNRLREQVTFWQGKYRIVVQENNALRRKLQTEKAESTTPESPKAEKPKPGKPPKRKG